MVMIVHVETNNERHHDFEGSGIQQVLFSLVTGKSGVSLDDVHHLTVWADK
jgi:hypothetical protein